MESGAYVIVLTNANGAACSVIVSIIDNQIQGSSPSFTLYGVTEKNAIILNIQAIENINIRSTLLGDKVGWTVGGELEYINGEFFMKNTVDNELNINVSLKKIESRYA